MVSNYRPYKEYQDRFKRIEEGYTLICLGGIKSEARRSAEELKTSTQSSESITARRTNDQRGRRVLEWQQSGTKGGLKTLLRLWEPTGKELCRTGLCSEFYGRPTSKRTGLLVACKNGSININNKIK